MSEPEGGLERVFMMLYSRRLSCSTAGAHRRRHNTTDEIVMRVGEAVEHGRQPDYMQILKLDEEELRRRLAFFELSDEDFKRLATLKPFADQSTHEITEGLY